MKIIIKKKKKKKKKKKSLHFYLNMVSAASTNNKDFKFLFQNSKPDYTKTRHLRSIRKSSKVAGK